MFYPFIAAFAYGGYLALSGALTLGTILALVNLCGTLSGPVADMSNQWAYAARALGAFGRVLEIVDRPPDADPALERESVEQAGPDAERPVVVRSLSFSYTEGMPVLRGVSFEVPKGGLAVIVGRSGCGKSTLLKLVSGLYRPPPGSVFVGGLDVHYKAISLVRGKTTYLPQEPYLFAGTVRDNLELGKEHARDEEYRYALSLADALDFVSKTPLGMGAQVGERGGALSGGQRQRLCVARAVLRDTEILLMDEPTSSVDKKSEARIWQALDRLMVGRTCLLVTHRPAVVEKADLILVMDDGRIVESGTHGELFDRHGLYWMLCTGEGGGRA
jgi:ABC-type multidrug transport system fused ATPase/permease subunit